MYRTLFLAIVAAAGVSAATTYTFSSTAYNAPSNFTNCTTGPCSNYSTAMSITGSFTVASALGPNFSGATDISSQVTAYSFTDGVNTYTNTDPNARLYQFNVATDGSGNISVASLLVEKWQSGSSPHAVGNRVAVLNLNGPTINQAENNLSCTVVGGGTGSGVTDLCVTATNDAASSIATASQGTWTGGGSSGNPGGTPTPVPTLGEWGMICLAGLLVVFAGYRLRRQATA